MTYLNDAISTLRDARVDIDLIMRRHVQGAISEIREKYDITPSGVSVVMVEYTPTGSVYRKYALGSCHTELPGPV